MNGDKELKLTVICRTCQYQYGRWRPRCPTCGEQAPLPPRAPTVERPPRARRGRTHACIVCRRTVKGRKATPPPRCHFCQELIHAACLRMHAASCERFQLERDVELQRLGAKS